MFIVSPEKPIVSSSAPKLLTATWCFQAPKQTVLWFQFGHLSTSRAIKSNLSLHGKFHLNAFTYTISRKWMCFNIECPPQNHIQWFLVYNLRRGFLWNILEYSTVFLPPFSLRHGREFGYDVEKDLSARARNWLDSK